MAKFKITQVRSKIGSNQKQRATLESLGLRKINHCVEHENTPVIVGMIKVVSHLVKVEEL